MGCDKRSKRALITAAKLLQSIFVHESSRDVKHKSAGKKMLRQTFASNICLIPDFKFLDHKDLDAQPFFETRMVQDDTKENVNGRRQFQAGSFDSVGFL